MATMPLREVDKVEILTILDNTIDLLLSGNDKVKRLPVPPDAFERESLVAEHGFAAPVTVSIGGFHLSGALFEPIIPPTVAMLKELNPELITPAHCTGWKAVHAIARELP
jgi:hypothetical protein